MNKSKVKKVSLFILGGAITVFILMMFLSLNNIAEIFDVVKTAELNYVLIALAFLLVYAIMSPLTLCMLAKSKKSKISFANSYVIGMTEHFFNGITPFSTGGQPFQVYAFNKVKVKPAESTGLLLMNFIIFMIVTNAFAICSLFFYGSFTSADVPMNIIAIIGFTMNFLVLFFMISLATSKKLRALLSRLLAALARIKFLTKFLEPKIPQLNLYFEQVQSAFHELFQKKLTFLACILVKIVTMAFYYAITFYILRALHIDVGYNEMFFVICGTSFAITMVVFLPTPGSSGGIEFAFHSIFISIAGVSATVAYGGMLLWRLLSYYLLMFVSLIFYIAFEIYFAKFFKRRHPELAAEAAVEPETEPAIEAVDLAAEPAAESNVDESVSVGEDCGEFGETCEPGESVDEEDVE